MELGIKKLKGSTCIAGSALLENFVEKRRTLAIASGSDVIFYFMDDQKPVICSQFRVFGVVSQLHALNDKKDPSVLLVVLTDLSYRLVSVIIASKH